MLTSRERKKQTIVVPAKRNNEFGKKATLVYCSITTDR
jgi:hypothetical protein